MLKYTLACAVACVAMVSAMDDGSMTGVTDWGKWSSWTPCGCVGSTSQRSRTRECEAPSGNCRGDATDIDTNSCSSNTCDTTTTTPIGHSTTTPRKPGWSAWTSWTACPVCGFGGRSRRRECNNPPPVSINSAQCEGKSKETVYTCSLRECRDGGWGNWTEWGDCSKSCGGGKRIRQRQCDNPSPLAKPGEDRNCKGASKESETCNETPCGWTKWTPWEPCSQKCNGGTKTRSRKCNGAQCVGDSQETVSCNSHSCGPSADLCKRCEYNENVGYMKDDTDQRKYYQCTRTERGYKIKSMTCGPRTRWDDGKWTCVHVPLVHSCSGGLYQADPDNCAGYIMCHHGKATKKCCGAGTYWSVNLNWQGCNTNNGNCAQSCTEPKSEWGSWGYWGPCSAACGPGKRHRYRSCNGSRCSGVPKETDSCNGPCTSGGCDPKVLYPDSSNCAAFKVCEHGVKKSRCCAPGTYYKRNSYNVGGCHGLKLDGHCTKSCVQSSGSCGASQLVRLSCGSIRNSCTKCPVLNTGVIATGGVCKFNPYTRKSKLVFNCFNNRFNEKNVKNFAIMTWFKTTRSAWTGVATQSILHNGDCKESPSISISLVPKQSSGGGPGTVAWHVEALVNAKIAGSVEVAYNQWNHVSLLVSGGNARLSVRTRNKSNKISPSVTTRPVPIGGAIGNTKCPLTIGQKGGKNDFYGQLDELRVYEEAISETKVDDICKIHSK